MRRLIFLFSLSFGLSIMTHGTLAVAEEAVKIQGEPRKKISESQLIRRYPVGKSWAASKVLRVRGVSKNKEWGFEGEQHVVYTNRYRSTVEVLDNELGELKLRVFVADMSQQRIVTENKLRVADFGKASPILAIAVSKAGMVISSSPYVGYVSPVLVLWGKIDPQYEKTLTQLLEWSGVDPSQLSPNTQLRIVEDPEPLAGCTFEVVWTNGLGITLCRQIDGPVNVKLDEVRRWALGADPLFDLYIMDTLNRQIGDRWEVDGQAAVNVLSAQGGRDSKGKVMLKYLRDTEFDQRACRHLAIQGGSLGFTLDRDSQSTDASASEIQGQILYDKDAYLVLEANGTCDLHVKAESKNHLLFKAEWQRDTDVDFRYEAKVLNDGR